MPEFKCLPLSYLDDGLLQPLMEEEEKAWMSDLNWDYSPIRQILVSLAKQKLLPGYVALNKKGAVAYAYFVVNQSKGIIGALYASRMSCSQEAIEELLSLTISSLKGAQNVKRIEAQIMPFHGVNLTATFVRLGFGFYPRLYLELDLSRPPKKAEFVLAEKITPWTSAFLEPASEMTAASYRDQTDAEICEDYRTPAGCETYLRSLVENSGCGIFMPETSFMGLDMQGALCGFVICSRISRGAGMIPQIAVHPSHQGRGLGKALIYHALEKLRSLGFQTVSLTVTPKNRRAFEWYQRLGFRIRKEFGAYVWERP